RPDLEHDVAGPHVGRSDQLAEQIAIDEEVLAEPLQRPDPRRRKERLNLTACLSHAARSDASVARSLLLDAKTLRDPVEVVEVVIVDDDLAAALLPGLLDLDLRADRPHERLLEV